MPLTVVSHHLFRRTARAEEHRIEKLQIRARGPLDDRLNAEAFAELKELGVGRFDLVTHERSPRGFRWRVIAKPR